MISSQFEFNVFNISQILSDPKKKEQYDNFGTVGDEGHKNRDSWTSHDFYRDFRGPGGQHSFMFEDSPFGSDDNRKIRTLNNYNYKNIVIPDSYHKPFLIFAIDDVCFECEYIS